jgi:hypothetical protein
MDQSAGGGYGTAFLDQDVGRAMYPRHLYRYRRKRHPTGQARRVPRGYRVSGRFPFASRSQHCEWIWLSSTTSRDAGLREKRAIDREHSCCFNRGQATIWVRETPLTRRTQRGKCPWFAKPVQAALSAKSDPPFCAS